MTALLDGHAASEWFGAYLDRARAERDERQAVRADDRAVDGATFILDAPSFVPAVWGDGPDVLWAQGEACMLYAPQGVGKTTIAGQLALRRAGVGNLELLGHMVTPDERRTLYVAADRPHQVARSFRRMVDERDRRALQAGLVVWPGPLPFNVARDPQALASFALGHGAGTLILDSVKDIAVGLADDEVGAAVNLAVQHTLAAGIEVLTLHHPRKANAANPKPKTLDDVYGSTWLTAGHGSVVLLWGKPGDLVVELAHIKQPAGEVGPFKVIHDHDTGRSRRHKPVELLELIRDAPVGLTVREAAVLLFGTDSPEENQVEKARRKLTALERDGHVEQHEPGGPRQPGRYRVRGLRGLTVGSRVGSDQPTEPAHDEPTQGSRAAHEAHAAIHRPPATPRRGAGGVDVDPSTPEQEAEVQRLLTAHPDTERAA